MEFPERLKELRKIKGLSQKRLADEIGVAQSSINYWEKGTRTPSMEACQKLADFFEIPTDYLIMGETKKAEQGLKLLSKLKQPYNLTELFSGSSTLNKEYEEKQKLKHISDSANQNMQHTIAAHFDSDEFTEDELDEIRQFAEFVKSKRNTKK